MRNLIFWLSATALAATGAQADPTAEQIAKSSDGVAVHVYEYQPAKERGALPVLMFHQAESDARGELGPIAEQFAAEGYHIFAADLRSGGNKFGGVNQTAIAAVQPAAMCSAYPDVLAAIDHVRKETGHKVVVIGSSYSAALVVKAAAERPADVAGFVSLSPASGEPVAGCEPEPFLAKVQAPGLSIRPKREIEAAPWIKAQAETWQSSGVPVQVFDIPAHGASMMVGERGGDGSKMVLKAVRKFMGSLQRDEGVTVESGEWRLKGDFRSGLANGRLPAVLLLNKANGDRRVYDRLAAELARRGISSLRLDLRGHGESVNAGKFIPFDEKNNAKLFIDEERDVIEALNRLRSHWDVDPERIAVIGASYSGELSAAAARKSGRYEDAYVLLSPGSLSEESIRAMDASGAKWLFVRAARERSPSVKAAGDEVAVWSKTAEVRVLDSDRHATDLLTEPLMLVPSIADWLRSQLTQASADASGGKKVY